MTPTTQSLLAELDTTLAQAPDAWRTAALRRIVDLFLSSVELYSDDHVAVFDEVMCRLSKKNVDRAVLAEVSAKLAPVDNAPANFVLKLARHTDVAVYGPILEHAKRLPDSDLAKILDRDRIDPKLLTRVVARPRLSEAVTDVLLKRGNPAIQRKIIDNPNARISETGFARVIIGINGNKNLAAAVAKRQDLPAELRIWLDKTLSA